MKTYAIRTVPLSDRYGDIFSFVIDDGTLDIKVSAWNQYGATVESMIKVNHICSVLDL